jgi:serine/threonine protein kinase/formylglycine-generating enzyme required for sulfatase activity
LLPGGVVRDRDAETIAPQLRGGVNTHAGVEDGLEAAPGVPPDHYDFLAPAREADEMGRLGEYRILKVLGAGGMGVVFQAEDPKLKRKLALKVMRPALAASESAKQRFLREAQTAAAIEHDNIVPIYQVGEDRGVPFIAMPLLKGEPLDARLERDKALPTREIIRIGREAARGLAAAHAAGLVHRDIKPANLWLEGEEGCVKVLDFGLARAASSDSNLTQQGAIVGTPAYMAPEQAAGQALDARCDLFSLGCVLYRMSTGRPPFKGADPVATLVSVAMDNPRPPVELRPELPRALSKLVMQLLSKRPENRPQSAVAVAEALQEIDGKTAEVTVPVRDEDRKAPAGRTSPREAGRKRSRRTRKQGPRWPWLVAGGVLGVAALVAAIVLLWPTPKGTVRIESDDPSVVIVFDKNGPTVKGAGTQTITLRAGEHGAVIQRGDFEFEADKFVLKKGTTITLKVELLPGKLQVKADDEIIGGHSLPQPVPRTVPEDKKPAPGDVPALPATYTNNLGMELVLVPRGKSWLGGGGGKPGDTEVQIAQDFYLGKYMVTQEEWGKLMATNPSHFSRTGADKKAVKDIPDADLKRFPVEGINWEEAQLFLTRLNERDKQAGWLYRLPSDTEWEYACRGGPMSDVSESAFDFYFDRPTNQLLPSQANFHRTLGRPCKVGSYKPNRLGLYDMHGNVGVMVHDREATTGQVTSRGAGWVFDAGQCRAANRRSAPLAHRAGDLGLRVARVPVAVTAAPRPTGPRPVQVPEDGWMKAVAAMPAAQQVQAVSDKMKELNPGFDGKLMPTIEDGVVTGLALGSDRVINIAPVRALLGLQVLNCSGTGKWAGHSLVGNGDFADLAPLKGLKLKLLDCRHTQVSDLSPLKEMPLATLLCGGTKVSDLSPLAGMKLTKLDLFSTLVTDLSPLAGMPLTTLGCGRCFQPARLAPLKGLQLTDLDCCWSKVSDLSPLKDMNLLRLNVSNTPVKDLSPLKDMKLTWLNVQWSWGVSDLSPLRGMPLTVLYCANSGVFDLSPLVGMPLEYLECAETKVTDLSPLKDLPLREIGCRFNPARDSKVLRSIKTLIKINGKPAADFWKEVDGRSKRP